MRRRHTSDSNSHLTDVEKDGLKGAVKQTKTKCYLAFEVGSKVYIKGLDDRKYTRKHTIFLYDENGKLKEATYLEADGDQSLEKLNDKGLVIERIYHKPSREFEGRTEITYNDQGSTLEVIHYDDQNKITNKYLYEYDERGNNTLTNAYDSTGALTTTYLVFYDENNFRIEQQNRNGLNEITYWAKHRNNHKGYTVETTFLNPDGTVNKIDNQENRFDENGEYKSAKRWSRTDDHLYTLKYEKDHHDNWIKKIVYYRNKAISIYIREIEYYSEDFKSPFKNENEFFNFPIQFQNLTSGELDKDELSEIQQEREKESYTKLEHEDAKWLVDKSPSVENFSYMAYYALKNDDFPSVISYNSQSVEALVLLELLKDNLSAQVVYSYSTNYENWGDTLVSYTVTFPDHDGYLLHASRISRFDPNEYDVPEFIRDMRHDSSINLSQIQLLCPSDASYLREENGIESTIKYYIETCTILSLPDQPEIYMVEVENQKFVLQSHPVKDNFEITDLDIHYGYGFEKFHDDLMKRFNNENKGLVLFHGQPGTGKTYYIRHLLREMATSNKIVIYMPPNMVDYLVEPNFMTFLSRTVTEYSSNNQFCVLLIEDAEPLLAARNSETRIQGVTNLLNMTDGLLNDMLKLQIVCTFNTDLKNLDEALLRPGRLIARKEFKALSELDANLLAQRLGIKYRFHGPATLSEIYARRKDQNTIIHDDY